MRKVVQLVVGQTHLYALCDDGTIWMRVVGPQTHDWLQIVNVPQPPVPKTA